MTYPRTILRHALAPAALLLAALGVTACGSDPAPSSPAGAKENAVGGKTTTTGATMETFPVVVEDTTTSTTLGPMQK